MDSHTTKTCFRCGRVKDIDEFYCHPQMGDGHLGKCKECTKNDVRESYALNRAKKSEYEKQRNQTPERRTKKRQYQVDRRLRNPEKYAANAMVARALKSGRLKKGPCVYCGSTNRIQAHHRDYSKPLDVIWVCFVCHREREHNQIVTARH